MTERYIVGIDAGGTKTSCLALTATGRLLGASRGGPGNIHAIGVAMLAQNVAGLIALALAGTGWGGPPAVLCIGAAGAGGTKEKTELAAALQAAGVTQRLLIEDDGMIALVAGTLGEPGVCIVAGTGSLAVGLTREGRRARAGGWGYLLGDEGSGYAIGRDALAAILRAHDGRGEPTALAQPLMATLGLAAPEQLSTFMYGRDFGREKIARLAPQVAAAAAAGDRVAAEIMQRAGRELASLAATVHRRLALPANAPVIRSGGIFRLGRMISDPFLLAWRAYLPDMVGRDLTVDPALGAAILALRSLDIELERDALESISAHISSDGA